MSKPSTFIPLASLGKAKPSPRDALAAIRRIYFKTTRRTVEHDIAHAIELLKSLPTEDEREKATVYMQGLADLRREWAPRRTASSRRRATGRRSTGSG